MDGDSSGHVHNESDYKLEFHSQRGPVSVPTHSKSLNPDISQASSNDYERVMGVLKETLLKYSLRIPLGYELPNLTNRISTSTGYVLLIG